MHLKHCRAKMSNGADAWEKVASQDASSQKDEQSSETVQVLLDGLS